MWKITLRFLRSLSFNSVGFWGAALVGLVFAGLAWKISLGWAWVLFLLGWLSAIDMVDRIVPDILILVLGVSIRWGIPAPLLNLDVALSLGGVCALLSIGIDQLWHRRILGLGDVKLMTLMMCFLPLHTIPGYFFIAGILGVVFWIAISDKTKGIPFVPALSVAWVITGYVK